MVLAAGGVTAGASGLYFSDDIRFGYDAVTRTARVAEALFVCINDYRRTLNEQSDDAAEQTTLLKACHKRCAVRTLRVLEKNGSIFIKLGQHLSSMGYLLPEEWVSTFVPLQDKCPVSSYESIEDMFLKDTGHRIEDDFEEFSKTPIGAASLAQVHTAVLKETGEKIAVKVQHPALATYVRLDLALTRFTFSTLKRFFPEYDLEWLSREMEFSLPQELDFSLEGKNAMRTSKYFKEHSSLPLIIPNVITARPRILVMQYLSGRRPDDLEYLDSHNISRSEVSATLARIFNTMIFATGCPLHCDPHAGNLAVRHNPSRRYPYNFDIILYDHGLYRDIDTTLRRNYAHLWLAVIDSDIPRMRKYASEVAGITDEQFPLFASAITGRDYRVLTGESALQSSIVSSRTTTEKKDITEAFGENLIQQLVELLGKVPRIILLILKTNDLTRSLDEGLQTGESPERTFLILAKYASRCVYEEEKEKIFSGVDDNEESDMINSTKQTTGIESTISSDTESASSQAPKPSPSTSAISTTRFRPSLPFTKRWTRLLKVWISWKRIELKLWAFERVLNFRKKLGLD